MNKVYVVQHQMRWDGEKLVPKFDLAPAEEHGKLVYLLGPQAGPFNPPSIIEELTRKLEQFTTDDCLLLIGNPCIIGWAVAIAAKVTNGEVKMLQWSGKERAYITIPSKIH